MIQPIVEAIQQAAIQPEMISGLAAPLQHLAEFRSPETSLLLQQMVQLTKADELVAHRNGLDQALQAVFQGLLQWRQSTPLGEDGEPAEWAEDFERLYLWSEPDSNFRNLILFWMAMAGTADGGREDSLKKWADLVIEHPPENRNGLQMAFGPLTRQNWDPPMWLLERLLREAIVHSQVAPAVFDLFNFYFRSGVLAKHPAEDRALELASLVERLSDSLAAIESGQSKSKDPVFIGRQVSDSVAMLVALCDALALLECQEAVPALKRALGLRHRRVQTEAAAALARLNIPEGKRALIKLADEPICRLRVLAFAEELGFDNEISLELRGEIAQAESQFAIWLSEPQQVGGAPNEVKLVDNREMYWPSYENPVQCYLFKYRYGQGENKTENIGIAGPITYAFPNDLTVLSVEDAYAVFAGWQTTHQEIFQLTIEKAERAFAGRWSRVMRCLEEAELKDVLIQTAASFFGQLIAVAECSWTEDGNRVAGTVIVEEEKVTKIPAGNEAAPVDWELAYCLWRGRQLLRTFNQTG